MSEVYEMAKACYLKLLAFEQEDPPSVSKAIFALVQATSGFIEYQILGLSTATESLIRAAFPELGAVEEEIKQEVQKFRETISELPYSCRFKNRLNGAASAMLNPDNASAIRTFIEKHGLGLDIHESMAGHSPFFCSRRTDSL